MEDMVKDRVGELDRRLARIEAFLATLGMPPAEAIATDQSVIAPDQSATASTPPPLPQSSSQPRTVQMLDERGALVEREVFVEENRFGETVRPVEAPPSPPEPPMATEAVVQSHSLSYERQVDLWAHEPGPNSKEEAFSTVFAQATPPAAPVAHTNVEQTIGLKLAGWIGAIVLVVGAAMGVKFAYDQGWLGGLPDELKLGLYYAIGIALIGAGEVVYRRVDKVAAVGLYAAGIAGLFVVSFAGNTYYQLYDQSAAFMLMAGTCAIGALISLRGGLVSIAVLSLLGANIAPLVLRNTAVGEVPLLTYLLTLQVLALGLAHVGKGARWWILRNVALVTLSLWMAGRLLSPATAFSWPTLLFVSLYAALFQIENTLAARKQGTSAFSHPTFSFAVTAALTIALLRWSMPLSDAQRGAIIVLLSFIAFTAGAAVFFTKLESLRHLAQSWLVQGGILLFAAVPVALSGPWIFVTWALMALGYAVLGAVLGRLRTASAGVIIWTAAVGVFAVRLAIVFRNDSLRAIAFEVSGTPIPTYFVIALLIAAIGYAISLILARRFVAAEPSANPPGSVPAGLAVVATALAAVVCIVALPTNGTTVAGIVLAWTCFALAYAAVSTANVFRTLAGVVIALTLARWVAMLAISHQESRDLAIAGRLVFNTSLALGALCVASLWAMARLFSRQLTGMGEAASRVVFGAILLGVIAMCIGLSFEIERGVYLAEGAGKQFAWPASQLVGFGCTALWAVAAMSLPWLGKLMGLHEESRKELRTLATFAVALIGVKFIVLDSLIYALKFDPAQPSLILNAQMLIAAMLLGLLIYSARSTKHVVARNVARSVIFLLPLVVGSIELSRIVGREKTLMAFSVYWGLYAILSIGVGFAFRASVLRYAGLGLLGITLLKIVLVDLANAGTGWRILSFLGVGSILLATSVLYGKLSPVLLGKSNEGDAADPVASPGGRG
jgi:uncharacterized membrane protein